MQDDQNGNGEEGPRKQHKRKCWRCGLYDCRGVGKCTNPCQDCDMSARGRTVVLGEIVERGGNYVQGCPSQHKRKKINMYNVLTCFFFICMSITQSPARPATLQLSARDSAAQNMITWNLWPWKTMTPPAQINTENDSICSLPAFWDVQKEWQRLDGCLGRKKCCWVDIDMSHCQGTMSRVICVNDFIKSLYDDINTKFFLPETLCRRFSYEKGL